MSEFHGKFKDHHSFQNVYRGDMFVYDESNGDIWSGFYGSKPDFKMHVKRIFARFRATESLMFVTRLEVEKLKIVKIVQPHIDQII